MTKFMEAYRDSLSHGPKAVTTFYSEPCVTTSRGVARVNATLDETERVLAEVDGEDRARGFTHADVRSIDVQPLGSSSALATVQWAYMGACEELLWTATCSYNLCRRDGVWKILVQTMHDV